MTQATVHEFLRRGNFESNLERVNGLLRERRDAMLDGARARRCPRAPSWSQPEGGYFMWVDLPHGGAEPRGRAGGRRDVRRGQGLLRRRLGRQLDATRVQLRVAGRDRRRRHALGAAARGRSSSRLALMLRVWTAVLAAAIAPSAALAASPVPHGAGHLRVVVVARGVPTPTEFAVVAGRLFVGGYGDENDPSVAGGVYLLRGGKAIRVPGSPTARVGLAAAKNTLYLSTRSKLLAWSGWNGTRFRTTRVIRTRAPIGGFRGVAVGPDGLIYTGADTTPVPPPPSAASVLSVDPATGAATVIASRDPPAVAAALPTRPRAASRLRSQPGRPRPAPPARLPPRDQAWRELRLPGLPGDSAYVCELLPTARQVAGPSSPMGLAYLTARSTSRCTAASAKAPSSCRCRRAAVRRHPSSQGSRPP